MYHLGYNTFLSEKGKIYDKNYRFIVRVYDVLHGASGEHLRDLPRRCRGYTR